MTVKANYAEHLSQVPLLAGLSQAEREQIFDVAETKEYVPGDVVLRQGKTSQNLWIVLSGSCEVYREPDGADGKQLVLAEISETCHFGEMSFFSAAGHSASVRAKTPLVLLQLRRADFDEMIRHDSLAAYKLAYNTLAPLADRLRRTDERLTSATQAPTTPHDQLTEWSSFRVKLFDGWNL